MAKSKTPSLYGPSNLPDEKKVTVCCTSCGRPDLLEQTMDSFIKMNTYPIEAFLIYEDSGTNCNDHLKDKYPFVTWMGRPERVGQIVAIDTMYQEVKTTWIHHQEEDWQFYRPGFIEASMEILESDSKLITVWLRELEDTNQHPVLKTDKGYGIMKTGHGMWQGFTFNPGLRRLKDYEDIKPFSRHTVFNKRRPWLSEAAIGQLYASLGFRAAILNQGYVRHIGADRHVF